MQVTNNHPFLDGVADVIEYPTLASRQECRDAVRECPEDAQELREALDALHAYATVTPIGRIEEQYSQLFDLSPVCTLNIGYHLFGEQYERGAFMAGLVGELRKIGQPPPEDLPDYLPCVLRLAARIQDHEEAQLLISHAVLPSLVRMNGELGENKSPWAAVLRALPAVLEKAFDTECIPADMFPTRDPKTPPESMVPLDALKKAQRNQRRAVHA